MMSNNNEIKPNNLICGDSIEEIKRIPSDSVDLILSDIPFGIGADTWDVLHDNKNSAYLGSSPAQRKAGAVFGKRGKPLNGWSEADKTIPAQYYNWCMSWGKDWTRILKPGASCFVFAGRRLAHRCICALEDSGLIFKDMLAWEKEAAAHRAQHVSVVYDRRNDKENAEKWAGWKLGALRPLFEPVLWFVKPYKIGGTLADNIKQYGVGAYNERKFIACMGNADNIIKSKSNSEDHGLHPTQKPVSLMKLLIELTTVEGQLVVDPFMGSGTTIAAAKELKRQYIGIEKDPKYFLIAQNRLK